jgi:hypothetical protein
MLFVIPKSVADSVYDTMQFHAAVKVTCELLLKTDFITIVSQKDSRQDGQISCITLVPAQSFVNNASPNKQKLQCAQTCISCFAQAVWKSDFVVSRCT